MPKIGTPLSEDLACRAIMASRYNRSLVFPRYTPVSWWECDVFELSRADRFTEYEVKLTVTDFKGDSGKEHKSIEGIVRRKHDMLALGDPIGPTRFYFVAPKGLVNELPKWAGLIELDEVDYEGKTWWRPRTVIKAPRLHTAKANPSIKTHMFSCAYYRLHDQWRTTYATT